MLFCPFAREVWDDVKKDFDIPLNRKFFSSPKTWLMEFMSKCTAVQATVLAVFFWHIWTHETRSEKKAAGDPLVVLLRGSKPMLISL
jgi:hypothetical protein